MRRISYNHENCIIQNERHCYCFMLINVTLSRQIQRRFFRLINIIQLPSCCSSFSCYSSHKKSEAEEGKIGFRKCTAKQMFLEIVQSSNVPVSRFLYSCKAPLYNIKKRHQHRCFTVVILYTFKFSGCVGARNFLMTFNQNLWKQTSLGHDTL